MSPEIQAQTLAEMKADWRQHREELMAASQGTLPWAAAQFDQKGIEHADE